MTMLCQPYKGIERRSCGKAVYHFWRDISYSDKPFSNSYLTKLTDQQFALISPEHAKSLIWDTRHDNRKPTGGIAGSGVLDENKEEHKRGETETDKGEAAVETNRLFRFRVEKTKNEAETASIYPGFEVCRSCYLVL